MTKQQSTKRTRTVGQSATILLTVDTMQPLHSWLAAQASKYGLRWLLLHSEFGVVWGEQNGNELALSTSAATLSWNALQQARLFGEGGELLVWQGPQHWQARLIKDGEGQPAEWFDEKQMLWGNRLANEPNISPGFMAIVEGAQGITHAPPLDDIPPTNEKRACLLVRHYLSEDAAGVVRVSYSRLVKLLKPGEK
jgi:CRISPR-associated protein (TIGR03984 family)